METKHIVSEKEPIAEDLSEGVHSAKGVAFLSKMAVTQLPKVVVFGEPYFSEPTAFMKASDSRGYYMVSMSECSCPDFRFIVFNDNFRTNLELARVRDLAHSYR